MSAFARGCAPALRYPLVLCDLFRPTSILSCRHYEDP
mgnify:CR=1 FL=1